MTVCNYNTFPSLPFYLESSEKVQVVTNIYIYLIRNCTYTLRHNVKKDLYDECIILEANFTMITCLSMYIYSVYQFRFSIMEMRQQSRVVMSVQRDTVHMYSPSTRIEMDRCTIGRYVTRNCRLSEKKRKAKKEKWSGRVKQESREPEKCIPLYISE